MAGEHASSAQAPPLTPAALKILQAHDWDSQVGDKIGIWVYPDRQQLYLIHNYRVVRTYTCSTGLAGMGNKRNSRKTPIGWHRIGAKIGDGLPVGAILKSRKWTKKVWKKGRETTSDLVLTRILRLRGLEPGKNLRGDVDSWSRYIYIHGTNHVDSLGKPSSHGCVRLDPKAVIELYDLVEKNTPVLITDWKMPEKKTN